MTQKLKAVSSEAAGLYETDFVAWAEQQVLLLQQEQFKELDLLNLIDEVQDLSRRERQALYSNLKVILLHLLKWYYQPQSRSNSWRASIREHRQRIARQLLDSPSLKPYLEQILAECYQDARSLAGDETGLPLETFPLECLYTITEILDSNFLGDGEANS